MLPLVSVQAFLRVSARAVQGRVGPWAPAPGRWVAGKGGRARLSSHRVSLPRANTDPAGEKPLQGEQGVQEGEEDAGRRLWIVRKQVKKNPRLKGVAS